MTTERDKDPDATVKMPVPLPRLDGDAEDFDPEKTLVREEWEPGSRSRSAAAPE